MFAQTLLRETGQTLNRAVIERLQRLHLDGEEELARAGAYRVYEDPRDFLRHLDEVGVRALDI